MEAEYLTEKQTAEYTGTKITTLRSWRNRGVGIPFVKIAGSVRYSKTDIDNYMKENTRKPDPAGA